MTRFIGSPYFTDALSERRYFRACVVEGLRLNLGDVVAVEVASNDEEGVEISHGEVVHLFEEGNAEGEYAEGGGAEVRWVQSRSEVKQESLKGCPPPLPMSLPRNQLKRLGMSSSLAVAEACERFLSDQVDDIPLQAVAFVVVLTSPKAFPSAIARQPNGIAPAITARSILREQKAGKEVGGKTSLGARRQRPAKSEEDEVEKSGSSEDGWSSDEDDGAEKRGTRDGDEEAEEVAAVNRVFFCARQFLKASRRFLDVVIDDSVKGSGERRLYALPQSAHEAAAAYDEETNEGQEHEGGDDNEGEDEEVISDAEDSSGPGVATASGHAKKKRRLSAPLGAKESRALMVEPLTDWVNASLSEQRKTLGVFNLALDRLTLSAVPKSLPCRENERSKIDSLLRRAVCGSGGAPVVYISGMPGTGKTATVREVATALKAEARLGKIPHFTFVELNGMRLPQPQEAYTDLWASLTASRTNAGAGERLTHKKALKKLEQRFSSPSAPSSSTSSKAAAASSSSEQSPMVVLLVDELDYLVTGNQMVLYNLFDWPSRPGARLVVVGVANTMDLPERLGGKMQSRLGCERIVFQSYTRQQVEIIVKSRLGELAGVFHPDAISLSARQVAAYSGDVRQALLICSRAAERRRTLLVADLDARVRAAALKTGAAVSRSGINSSSGGGKAPGALSPRVAIEDVVGARAELNDSAHMRALRSCTFGEALLLVALGAELRASGREEVKFQAIVDKVRKFCVLELKLVKKSLGGPPSLAELLEIAERLHEARIVRVAYPGRSGASTLANEGHLPSQAFYVAAAQRLPQIELAVGDTVLARALAESHKQLSDRFFPVDEDGVRFG